MAHANHLIDQTRQMIEKKFSEESSGHDWWHIYRVWTTAKSIADAEGAERTVVELAALLHDIADWKFYDGNDAEGPQQAEAWLKKLDADQSLCQSVSEIIATVSYKGAGLETPMKTLEGKVVQDADRLDAIGAMGIGRAFAYGGHEDRLMYHPDQPPVIHENFEDYKKNKGHTINHFYEKLLLLKDRMNTSTAKKIAAQRHEFMEGYLEQFLKEWNGHG